MKPNPDAIAWYVQEAQRLLEEQQRRAESLKTRSGQIAGFGAAVLALIGGNVGTILGAVEGSARSVVGLALFAALVSLAVSVSFAVWAASKPTPFTILASDEIATYASDRFLTEPDLWRVHLRSLHTLEKATREAQGDGNAGAEAILISLYAFLLGLALSLVPVGALALAMI